MRHILGVAGVAALVCFHQPALAADDTPSLAIKNGETVNVMPVFGERKCKSILTATPQVEVLEGPAEIKLSVREEMVTPRRGNCKEKIKGGMVVATANDIKARAEAKLTFRVKYKTSEGERQTSHTYNVTLFPGS